MKKILIIMISIVLLTAMFGTAANAVTYVTDSTGSYADIGFHIDYDSDKLFNEITLKLKWYNLFIAEKDNLDKYFMTYIHSANVKSEITDEHDGLCDGETTFTYKDSINTLNSKNFLFTKIWLWNISDNARIDYYVDGELKDQNGVDCRGQHIVKTGFYLDDPYFSRYAVYEPFLESIKVNDIGTDVVDDRTVVIHPQEYTSFTQPSDNSQPQSDHIDSTEPDLSSAKTTAETEMKDNPLSFSASTKAVKVCALKKKTIKLLKVFKIKNAKGALNIELKSVTACGKKVSVKKFKVKKNGTIVISKGKYKTGTYRFKVNITAEGNSKYLSKKINKSITLKFT